MSSTFSLLGACNVWRKEVLTVSGVRLSANLRSYDGALGGTASSATLSPLIYTAAPACTQPVHSRHESQAVVTLSDSIVAMNPPWRFTRTNVNTARLESRAQAKTTGKVKVDGTWLMLTRRNPRDQGARVQQASANPLPHGL